jgi:alcohol dehydrogenase class IV
MKSFTFYQPTRLHFGNGSRNATGDIVKEVADHVLFVIDPGVAAAIPNMVQDVRESLTRAGVKFVEFANVSPNPTLEAIQEGAARAREAGVNGCVGMGGGSAIDTAKAIAVAATHPGTAWDYLYYKTAPSSATLPIVAISTTSGTGTQTSKVSVFTNTAEKDKSAMWNDHLLCRSAIIDPELMMSLPQKVTAATGFDVFTHTFESYINDNAQPYVDLIALDAIERVVSYLPRVIDDPSDNEARAQLAWADTLAGVCLANVGTTLPHAAGQPLSGHYPQISHGESLAIIYPAFAEFTWPGAVEKFAVVSRIFGGGGTDKEAARSFSDIVAAFLERIKLRRYMDDFGIETKDLGPVLKHAMAFPDHTANPVKPSEADMRDIYLKSYRPGAAKI